MLKHLTIENYALIRKLDIEFSEGFSVITGETGAGKSILIGALSLILGQRADTQMLMDKSKKCIVEGSVYIKEYKLAEFLEKNDLDYEDNTILRREIIPGGKSRAFINDTPVNLNLLKEFGERLINIHSQHKILTLNDMNFQLAVIDNFAQHSELIKTYKDAFRKYEKTRFYLNELTEQEKKSKKDHDYFQFLFDELENANLKNNEQSEIENELEILNHSEEIKVNLLNALQALLNTDNNVLSQLYEISSIVSKLTEYHEQIKVISSRLDACIIELKDISTEIESLEQSINYDPEQIDVLNKRLDTIYTLEQKHRVSAIEQLLDIKADLSNKLLGISNLDDEIGKTRKQLDSLYKDLSFLGEKISQNRKQQIPLIEKELLKMLAQLSMKDAQFKIVLSSTEKFSKDGMDNVIFLFNANKGGDLKEISKIASGGELSRLMLSVKSLISQKNLLPTIIFDEIDIGVSGDIADKVGNIMRDISTKMQLIAITHLPQIAAKGDEQFHVYKENQGASPKTKIKRLEFNSRVEEIAKMLSSDKITDAAKQTAKELLAK